MQQQAQVGRIAWMNHTLRANVAYVGRRLYQSDHSNHPSGPVALPVPACPCSYSRRYGCVWVSGWHQVAPGGTWWTVVRTRRGQTEPPVRPHSVRTRGLNERVVAGGRTGEVLDSGRLPERVHPPIPTSVFRESPRANRKRQESLCTATFPIRLLRLVVGAVSTVALSCTLATCQSPSLALVSLAISVRI